MSYETRIMSSYDPLELVYICEEIKEDIKNLKGCQSFSCDYGVYLEYSYLIKLSHEACRKAELINNSKINCKKSHL